MALFRAGGSWFCCAVISVSVVSGLPLSYPTACTSSVRSPALLGRRIIRWEAESGDPTRGGSQATPHPGGLAAESVCTPPALPEPRASECRPTPRTTAMSMARVAFSRRLLRRLRRLGGGGFHPVARASPSPFSRIPLALANSTSSGGGSGSPVECGDAESGPVESHRAGELYVERRAGEGKLQTTTRFVCRGNEWHAEVEADAVSSGGGGSSTTTGSGSSDGGMVTAAVDRIIHFFLPAGYPASVSDGYLRYCVLGVGAGVASSAAFVLSTQSLLFAVGLGAGSIPLAAAMNWVIKDGLGQAGGIVFAAWLGRRKGMDADPKKWRSVSALAMDAATLMEILSPLVPGFFLAVASVANVGKNIAYLSASASRAALNNHFAAAQNLADLTAKAGSQSIFASLAGTALGVALSPVVGTEWTNVALGFAGLSAVHQACTFLSLRDVPLRTLNRERLHHVLTHFLANQPLPPRGSSSSGGGDGSGGSGDGPPRVLTPSEVARLERFAPLLPMHPLLGRPRPFAWVDTHTAHIHELLPRGRADYDAWAAAAGVGEATGDGGGSDGGGGGSSSGGVPGLRYVLRYDAAPGCEGVVHVGFLDGAMGRDALGAFLHAQLCVDSLSAGRTRAATVHDAGARAAQLLPGLVAQLTAAGWDCDRVFLEPQVVRYAVHVVAA